MADAPLDPVSESALQIEGNQSEPEITEESEDTSTSGIEEALAAISSDKEDVETDEQETKNRYKGVLAMLQYCNVRFHQPNIEISEERAIQLKKELEESLDDLWNMRAYIINHLQNEANKPKEIRAKTMPRFMRINNLKVISWDLGMLCYQYMGRRAEAVADIILKGGFDIVFLQEVNRLAYDYLRCRLQGKYSSFCGKRQKGIFQDFAATFIRLNTVAVVNEKVIYFERTRERRSLLRTDAIIGNAKFCLLNTHLDSMLGKSLIRMQQLKKCFSICQSVDSGTHVIFCGSLNIREWELERVKMPTNLTDLWSKHGNPKNQYTWDLKINPMIQMPVPPKSKSGGQPQKRFGRMYIRYAVNPTIQSRSFDLVGKDIVAAGKYYPSDHWRLVSKFSVDKKCYERKATEEDEPTNTNPLRNRADLLEGEDEENETKMEPEVKDNWDDSE